MYRVMNPLEVFVWQLNAWTAGAKAFGEMFKPREPHAVEEEVSELAGVKLGDEGTYSRTIRSTDTADFGQLSGDQNPVHFDPEYARTTRFKECIAHGMHSMLFISTAIAQRWPGAVLADISAKFTAPVKIGRKVDASATVIKLIPGKSPRARLHCVCKVDDQIVIAGEILILLP